MKLDHVPAWVVDKDLLGSGSIDPGHRPVRHVQPIKFCFGLRDVSNRERDVRDGRVLSGSLGKRRWLLTTDQMNLPTLSDIDPETGHSWDLWATGIGFEPKHILVEFPHGFELWRF